MSSIVLFEKQEKIMRHSVEYSITSSGENSTMIGEYRSSYSEWP